MLDRVSMWIGIVLIVFAIAIATVPELVRWLAALSILIIGIILIVRSRKK